MRPTTKLDTSESNEAGAIRTLVCELAREKGFDADYNPLRESDINELLDELANAAFQIGVTFGRKNPL